MRPAHIVKKRFIDIKSFFITVDVFAKHLINYTKNPNHIKR
jgi:hypothetical protein